MLEFKSTPYFDALPSEDLYNIFNNITGIDIDENAIEATRLSLTLLYLVLMGGSLPSDLDIFAADAIDYMMRNPKQKETYDIVIANPPYISFDSQREESREIIKQYLGNLLTKKPDTYLAFLKLAVETLKPGGYGMFVIPHSFLRSDSANKIREFIQQNAWLLCLVDLSTIPVFKEKGSYVILLIFQKKIQSEAKYLSEPKATIVVCQDLVGHALQDYLLGKRLETKFYSIFDLDQSMFNHKDWSDVVRPQAHMSISTKMKSKGFFELRDICEIKQGIITGADDVFIVSKDKVPSNEKQIWKQLLRDRDMLRYAVPQESNFSIFYPFYKGKLLTEEELRNSFPETWNYLETRKKDLPKRKGEEKQWWLPSRLRDPNIFANPKLITPHLVLVPKFSLDLKGKFIVTHAPIIYPKIKVNDKEFSLFLLAVLNSTVGAWLLSTHSDKYSRGYARLEVKTLSDIPIPDPAKVDKSLFNKLIALTEEMVINLRKNNDSEIDEIVASIYELNPKEKLAIGYEGYSA